MFGQVIKLVVTQLIAGTVTEAIRNLSK